MFASADDIRSGSVVGADLVIVGAGAAGITIALQFVASGARVLLLESGDLAFDQRTQDLCNGTVSGLAYPLESSRLRYFGGTTNHWGGWVRPLDDADFSGRPWVEGSGWPISGSELGPYYAKALGVSTGLEPAPFDWTAWAGTEGVEQLGASGRLSSSIFRIAPLRFGEVYRSELAAASDVQVLLGANVTEVLAVPDDPAVQGVTVRTLQGNEFTVVAQQYVLALGGIENARLLLASRGGDPGGLANPHDLVGRYFMDHIEADVATFVSAGEVPGIYLGGRYDLARAMLTLTEETLEANELAGVGFVIERRSGDDGHPDASELPAASVAPVLAGLTGRATSVYGLNIRAEPEPNPESRVTLNAGSDALGMPTVDLHRMLTTVDRRRLRRSVEVLASALGETGAGWVRRGEVLDGDAGSLLYGWHHMGTTRMGTDRSTSVVDSNCRPHGVENLWIAGSSVFPSVGYANPTLTIVALALRMADHLMGGST